MRPIYRTLCLLAIALAIGTVINFITKDTIKPKDVHNIVSHALHPEIHPNKFLKYKILKNASLPHNIKEWLCMDDVHNEVRVFHESFNEPGLLDFDTQIETNLNILQVGSSIGDQLAQSLQRSAQSAKKEVIRYCYRWYHENTHISLTSSGGTIASLRVTGLMSNKTRDDSWRMSPTGGGGWLTHDVRELKRMVNEWHKIESISGSSPRTTSPCDVLGNKNITINSSAPAEPDFSCKQKNFDTVVHQFPVEWVKSLEMFTMSYIDEIVSISFEELGVNTIILQTITINNNIENMAEYVTLNEKIWTYAREFQRKNKSAAKDGTKRKVFVMDMFAFSVSLFTQNSMAIGLISNKIGKEFQKKLNESPDFGDFLNLTLESPLKEAWTHFIPAKTDNTERIYKLRIGHTCGDDTKCAKKSIITSDGMHWCMDIFGGRINAALACLLQCSLSDIEEFDDIIVCEKRCNQQYMSLNKVS